MLNLENITIYPEDGETILFYEGEHHYTIRQIPQGFSLHVKRLDGACESYGCSTLSTAIASIEALENGEEI